MNKKYIATAFTIAGITAAAFFYFSGSKEKSNKDIGIEVPIPEGTIAFDQYTLHPDSSITIERATGTQLIVPAQSFKRKDGSYPTNTVSIKVRELHDPFSIMRSGIPMEVAGTGGQHLQSAGMIEIRAFENGNELEMREGKNIGIELAAFKPSAGYSLYYLENDRQWATKDTFTYIENTRRKTKLDQLANTITPPAEDTTSNNDFVFVIDGDTSSNPELKPFLHQEWQLLEMEKLEAVKKAIRQSWSKIDIRAEKRRKMEYRITFSIDESIAQYSKVPTSFSLLAKPVMNNDQSKRKNRKSFEEKMEAYHEIAKRLDDETQRVKQQAEMVNAFAINRMGIWNIDKILKEDFIITHVHFDFEDQMIGPSNEHKVFMIYEENNTVVYAKRNEWKNLLLPKNTRLSIVAVLPNAKVAIISAEKIAGAVKKASSETFLTSEKLPLQEWIARNQKNGMIAKNE